MEFGQILTLSRHPHRVATEQHRSEICVTRGFCHKPTRNSEVWLLSGGIPMSNRATSGLFGAAFILSASGFAFAADMAVKAPPPAPAPVYSWTGFYVGGNVGYSWGDARTDIAGSANAITAQQISGGFTTPSTFAFADSNTARLNGIIGGGQLGYNYQFAPQWVLGFEADIQGSGERGSNSFVDPFSTPVCVAVANASCAFFAPLNGTAATSYEAKIEWFGTVRGRLGFLLNDQLLLYGTGGLAYGRVNLTGNSVIGGSVPGFPLTTFSAAVPLSAAKTNTGFSVGGGVEGKFPFWLPPNWTWKLEYLYLDLGSLDAAATFAASPPNLQVTGGTINVHTHFTDNIVRVGLNYQFH
jgi:outer membrane immunogenic protein